MSEVKDEPKTEAKAKAEPKPAPAVTIIEQAVTANRNQVVRVRTEGTGIRVYWPCNTYREFRREDLRDVINNVERCKAHPDVWLKIKDRYGSAVWLRVVEGELYADEKRNEDLVTSDGYHVSWEALRKALKRTLE